MHNIADLLSRSAHRGPSRIAVRFGEHAASYADLADQVRAAAAGLRAQGVSPGDRVAIYTEKRIETVVALFAVSGIRAVFVPINPLLKAAQVKHILDDSGAAMLITTPARLASLPFLSEHAHGLQVVVIGAGADVRPGAVSWPEIAGHAWDRATLLRGTDHDIAAILYTSGSTGRAKGVVLSQRNLIAGAESVNTYLANTQEDVILSVLPLSFDAGFSQLTTAFHVSAQVVLLNYLRPQDIADACERYRVTAMTAVPPLWNQIAAARFTSAAAEHLGYFANTGGHLSRPLLQQLRALFPNAKPFLMYGLTEAFRSTYLDPAEIDRRPDSIGKAVPNAEVLVLRPDGTECRPGEPGELVHRGVFVTRGYWNDPERTAERFRPLPSWPAVPLPELAVWSGDIVRKDEENFLYYIGRNDEMIKTQGYRVSPTEIEDVVYQSRLVAEAVAVGVPDAERGEAIVLVAAAAEGTDVDAEAIRGHCAKCLPRYMVPLSIVSQPSLPRNVNGKLDRPKIKAQVLALFQAPSSIAEAVG